MIGYTFSARGVGYIPATAMVVMVLFGLWSMGKQGFLWYAAPALVALLLLIAQSSHEKSNLFQVLPMAAMLVALGLLIAPGQNVVLGPLHEVAMNLKQTITDYLFFTEPATCSRWAATVIIPWAAASWAARPSRPSTRS